MIRSALMTTRLKDFYYTAESGESIRVEAENWERIEAADSTGQCNTRYLVSATLTYRYLPPFDNLADVVREIEKPLNGPIGALYPYSEPGPGRWLIDYAGNTTTFDKVSNGYLQCLKYENFIKIRLDGLPDNCGSGECRTEFYREGQVIHTVDFCPPISEEPPGDCCCDCCDELAAIARTIRV